MNQKIPSKDILTETSQLYASREQIYTRSFSGFYRNLRRLGGSILFLLYFGTVWLQWNGRQAIWWNLPERKFYILGSTFWPQDFILLSSLLIICAFGLFFITVFGGRIWCGYTCPQSVWTWVFMRIEKITEGDRNQRIKRDKQNLSLNKFFRKLAKHTLWLAVGLATAITFVGYFSPIRELIPELFALKANAWAVFWIAFFMLATYGNAGWLREQVCIYMCPYARFQSVMFDKDTLIVSYDSKRGETRGARKKDTDYKSNGMGDCVDCHLCVQVCPTGIDIRDGLQLECIGCAACIDACDSIMKKMNYPKGLVSYTTEHNLSGKKTHILRPRLIGYAVALCVMLTAFGFAVSHRSLVALDVIKDRIIYRENHVGDIENVYTLKVMNKSQKTRFFTINASGIKGLVYEGDKQVKVHAGEVLSVPVDLIIAPEKLKSSVNKIIFHVQASDDSSVSMNADSRFNGPSIY
ncbi:UNVERIFIED_CONTAM: hypothetical protein GTU68_008584 [Idotea baltica]|nr:hypothetical protein [Idotea baltica]